MALMAPLEYAAEGCQPLGRLRSPLHAVRPRGWRSRLRPGGVADAAPSRPGLPQQGGDHLLSSTGWTVQRSSI